MKKILSLSLVLCICILALISCSKVENDPVAMAQLLDEDGYYVELYLDESDIEDIAEEFEISRQGVYCMLGAFPEEDEDEEKGGFFVFCDKTKNAKEVEEDLNDVFDDLEDEFGFSRMTVVRDGEVVFFGNEGMWEKLQ